MSRRTIYTLLAVVFAALGGVGLWVSTRGDYTWPFVAACFFCLAGLVCWEERRHGP